MTESFRKRYTKEEYEIQHFGFSSTDFLFQFRNIIDCRIEENLEELEGSIAKKLNLDSAGKEKLHEEILELINFAKSKVHERFENDVFQEYIRSFFDIPENVLLSSDEIHYEDVGDDTVASLTREIDELEKQYKKDTFLIKLYNKELEVINKLAPVEEIFHNTLEQINQWPKLKGYKNQVENYIDLLSNNIKNAYVKQFGTCNLKSSEKVNEKTKKCEVTEQFELDDL